MAFATHPIPATGRWYEPPRRGGPRGQGDRLDPQGAEAARPSGRSRRVLLLLGVIFVLSVADLVLTLIYLREVGMIEANPIARRVMSTGSPAVLVGWKLALVAFAVSVLGVARRRLSAEIGAWIATAALGLLCLQWHSYIGQVHELTPYLEVLERAPESNWMAMTDR